MSTATPGTTKSDADNTTEVVVIRHGAGPVAVGPVSVGPVAELPEPAAVGEAPKATRTRLYALDLLRFLAALFVFCTHVIVDNHGTWGGDTSAYFGSAVHDAASYGWLGVELFFIISGFVICMSCWGRSLSDFLISRITRLAPAYMFAVLFTAGMLTLWPLKEGRPEPSVVLFHLTMLQEFLDIPKISTIYWTLFIELKFYILFAVVVYFGLTYRRVVAFCMVWTALSLYAQLSGVWAAAIVVEPRFTNYFVGGITLFLMYRFGPNLLLWFLLFVSVALSLYQLIGRVAPFNPDGQHNTSYSVAAVLVLGFFGIVLAAALGWLSWLRWRGFVYLGALTYPLYLLHTELSRVVLSRLHQDVPAVLMFTLLLGGTMVLAYAVNRLVERPVARYLRRGLKESFAQIRATDAA